MYMIWCDASIEPFNPHGILAWAFIVKRDGKIIHQDVHISGWGEGTTNNIGEYQAVLAALMWLISLPEQECFPAVIHSDSELIVKQMKGEYRVKDKELAKIYLQVHNELTQLKKCQFQHIRREHNKEADAMVNEALDRHQK